MPAPVRYTVTCADPRAHLFAVECVVATPDPRGQVFRLPSWIRGSYLVRDFAKHIIGLQARSGRRAVAIERLDKRSFACAPVRGALTISYQVYAFDESVRKAYLDPRRGFFNASSLCYAAAGCEGGVHEIRILRPSQPELKNWRVATTLAAVKTDRTGFGHYRASDYEDLIDHPVELGDFQRIDFKVDGIAHAMVLAGRCEADGKRLARDLTRVCHTARAMFGQQPKLAQYLFLTNVVGSGYGGLEHRASTALICARADLPRPGDPGMSREYRGFLGLCSHEYFHLWNVKRITPQRFSESDLAAEAYTQDLWHYEGVTSYYDDLLLLRAGLLDAPTYLDVLAENATRLARTPGRARQTLAEASFEAWIKYYQPDENTQNATVSYYVKGALAALCLDLTLRLRSKATLDSVMRELWLRHGAQGIGVPEGGLEAIAQEISGLDLRRFFDAALRGTGELPLAELLAEFGVAATLRAPVGELDTGGRTIGEPPRAWSGIRLKPGELRVAYVVADSPAARAGVSGNDLLVALDGLRLVPGTWAARVAALTPDQSYALHLFRGDELIEVALEPAAPPLDTWTITLAKVRGAALRRRRAWLGA